MVDSNYFFSAQGGLETAEGATTIFDVLYYTIEVLEVFPNELLDA